MPTVKFRWSDQEIDMLKDLYKQDKGDEEIQSMLYSCFGILRGIKAIMLKRGSLGLTNPNMRRRPRKSAVRRKAEPFNSKKLQLKPYQQLLLRCGRQALIGTNQ